MKGLEFEIEESSSSRQLYGKTVFITGASDGIGKQIALRLAKDGANIVVAGAADEEINDVVNGVEAEGGRCLAVIMDIRNAEQIKNAVDTAIKKFNGIDILINNACVVSLTDTEETDMKKYDLMNNVNARGTFLVTKLCLPHLKKSKQSHVLCITPPINLGTEWIAGRVPFAIAKYGMSMCVIGMSQEFKGYGVTVNGLWPRRAIASDEMSANVVPQVCRKPQIMADAAYAILTMPSDQQLTGQFFLDEEILTQTGTTNFEQYCVDPAYINQLVFNSFIEDFDKEYVKKSIETTVLDISKSETASQISNILAKFESLFDEALVKSVNKIFQIIITGDEPKKLYIDLKNGSGCFKIGDPSGTPDIILSLNEESFYETFVKGIKPSFAYMNGKITLEGDKHSIRLLDKIVVSAVSKL